MSMKDDRLRLQGQLAEHNRLYKNYDMEVSGLIILIRDLINPFENDVTRLKTGSALQSMKRLDKCVEKMKEIRDQIKEIEDELGE